VGNPYGEAERVKIAYSRALVRSILNGALDQAGFDPDPLFGFMVPRSCEGIPPEILNPRAFSSQKTQYKDRAAKLASDFKENFKQFDNEVPKEVLASMP